MNGGSAAACADGDVATKCSSFAQEKDALEVPFSLNVEMARLRALIENEAEAAAHASILDGGAVSWSGELPGICFSMIGGCDLWTFSIQDGAYVSDIQPERGKTLSLAKAWDTQGKAFTKVPLSPFLLLAGNIHSFEECFDGNAAVPDICAGVRGVGLPAQLPANTNVAPHREPDRDLPAPRAASIKADNTWQTNLLGAHDKSQGVGFLATGAAAVAPPGSSAGPSSPFPRRRGPGRPFRPGCVHPVPVVGLAHLAGGQSPRQDESQAELRDSN